MTRSHAFATRGWVGIVLLAIFWPLNWMLEGVRTAYLFFPLWLGYILVVDALVERRAGNSIWTRSRKDFIALFILSAPAWWLFEVINWRLGNWEYVGGQNFTRLEYHILSTICFSTVMPAVFGTAELARTWRWMDRLSRGPNIRVNNSTYVISLLIGIAMVGLMLIWPRACYPFAWTSLVFILEPLNRWLGRPHFLEQLQQGNWLRPAALATGALICGFFWEFWNFWSYPKWIYHTPGVEFLHIFEMPLLGYLGYIPFGWELFLLNAFLWKRSPRMNL